MIHLTYYSYFNKHYFFVGAGKSASILQLLVSESKSPEHNNLKGFNSLKEYSLQFSNSKSRDRKKIVFN